MTKTTQTTTEAILNMNGEIIRTITVIKHESNRLGLRTSTKTCDNKVELIEMLYGVKVTFYGRYQYDCTSKCHVMLNDKNELHVFENNTDAYSFLCDIYTELGEENPEALDSLLHISVNEMTETEGEQDAETEEQAETAEAAETTDEIATETTAESTTESEQAEEQAETNLTAYNPDNGREIEAMFSKAMCAYANWQETERDSKALEATHGKQKVALHIEACRSEYEATVRCIALFVKEHVPEICSAVIGACEREFWSEK